jgi:hypothetical protein
MIRVTWALTVLSVIAKAAAISLLERPSAINARTSHCRRVSSRQGTAEPSGAPPAGAGSVKNERHIGGASANAFERRHQHLQAEVGRQEAAGAGVDQRERSFAIVAIRGDQDRRSRSGSQQPVEIGQADLPAGPSAKKDHREAETLFDAPSQLGGRCDIDDAPPLALQSERQFDSVATQSAWIDDREMAANRIRTARSCGLPVTRCRSNRRSRMLLQLHSYNNGLSREVRG